jgi:hypothetical protein
MTVMLRTLGIPARIVNGFQSGTFNPISEMFVIRESDAHSWVEAYEPRLGWITFDPTPPAPRSGSLGLFGQAAMYLDAAETFWQEWVVNYDLARQITLAEGLEERTRGFHWGWRPPDLSRWKEDLKDWSKWFAFVLLAGTMAGILRRMIPQWRHGRKVRSGRVSPADATLLYERMLKAMKGRGYQKPPWFTPGEFADTLPETELGLCVCEFTEGYQALRFGGDVAAAKELSGLLERMEKM